MLMGTRVIQDEPDLIIQRQRARRAPRHERIHAPAQERHREEGVQHVRLPRSSTVTASPSNTINRSTTLGSIARVKSYKFAPAPAYKVTKAALNMLTVQYAEDYTAEGFTFVAISPGVNFPISFKWFTVR
jgi:NAD(P)-dependent dehydrogenase (short-subunit alcohol dehydrogenase family)